IWFINTETGYIHASARGESADAVGVFVDVAEGAENPAAVEVANYGVIVGDIRVGEGAPNTTILLGEESETYGNVRLAHGADNIVEIWAGAVITGSVDGGADPGKETQISHLLLTGDDNKTTELRAHSFRTVQITGGDW